MLILLQFVWRVYNNVHGDVYDNIHDYIYGDEYNRIYGIIIDIIIINAMAIFI